jgi:hypothetical protein
MVAAVATPRQASKSMLLLALYMVRSERQF